jgi:hypothetical protein
LVPVVIIPSKLFAGDFAGSFFGQELANHCGFRKVFKSTPVVSDTEREQKCPQGR